MTELKTFDHLFEFLKTIKMFEYIQTDWSGKNKLESITRIFAYLGIIPSLTDYTPTLGNYQTGSVKKCFDMKLLMQQSLKDKNDCSDLTMIHKTRKEMLITTIKDTCHGIGKMDLAKIESFQKHYPGYKFKWMIVVKNKSQLYAKVKRSEFSSVHYADIIKSAITLDSADLCNIHTRFLELFLKNNYPKTPKRMLILRFHQQLTVLKTNSMLTEHNQITWGHIPRSGKTYIMAGMIQQHTGINYLIITLNPNETVNQYKSAFDYAQFEDYSIIVFNTAGMQFPETDNKKIIICSKQFLDNKDIQWLKNLHIDLTFVDEAHNGGTTDKSICSYKKYSSGNPVIFMTATYSKVNAMGIDQIINWDLSDVYGLKSLQPGNQEYNTAVFNSIIRKHGAIANDLIQSRSIAELKSMYSQFPNFCVFTETLTSETVNQILARTEDNNYGFSFRSLLLTKPSESVFQNIPEIQKFIYNIFGRVGKFGIPITTGYLHKIIDHARLVEGQRVPGEAADPTVIMMFIPSNNINNSLNAFEKLMLTITDTAMLASVEYYYSSSNRSTNAKTDLEATIQKARNNGKRFVLVITGRQLSLAVTIKQCDIVIIANDSQSYDMRFQSMMRCLSEDHNKKTAYIIDLNIRQLCATVSELATKIYPGNSKLAVQKLLQQRLIQINPDITELSSITDLSSMIYEIYSSNFSNQITRLLKRLDNISCQYDGLDELMKIITSTGKSSSSTLSVQTIKSGIETANTTSKKQSRRGSAIKSINLHRDFTKFVIPLVCIITMNHSETRLFDLFEIIKSNKILSDIFKSQLITWWKIIPKNLFALMQKFATESVKTPEILSITKKIKELFAKARSNPQKLSKLIDDYLIPHDLDRVKNAEVSTPWDLRYKMLKKIPASFWQNPDNKVFEPCCGKGGFLIDIVRAFMSGLKQQFPDWKQRYKHILENCVYYSDVNKINLYIAQLLLGKPGLKLNSHLGNTLELDIKKKWNIEKFDAVVGNPPYNMSNNNSTGNTIWQQFVKYSIARINQGGFLVFVHPSNWRKPTYNRSQLKGLFELMCKKNYMKYLEMHNTADGLKTFKCGTNYDWYVIKICNTVGQTIIIDTLGEKYLMNLGNLEFLANYNLIQIAGMLATVENKLKVWCNSAYHATRDYVSDAQSDEFKYPLVHSTPRSGIRYKYSKINNKGHFGISKIIFGESGVGHVVVDTAGEYGLTQGAIAIEVNSQEQAEAIKTALLSPEFKNILKAITWGNFRIDWRFFTYLKADFWNYLHKT